MIVLKGGWQRAGATGRMGETGARAAGLKPSCTLELQHPDAQATPETNSIRISGDGTQASVFFIYLFIYLFLAVLGLRFCARAFSSCGEQGPLFITVHGSLTIAASLVAEHRLQTCRLSSCGSWAQLLRGMWHLPRPGLEPTSPALAGRLSTTAPPGKLSVGSLLLCTGFH